MRETTSLTSITAPEVARAKKSSSCGVAVTVETEVDFARALERLRRRDTESLAAFILSLAQDSGPVGEQVRTFIVGDVVAEAAEALRVRIKGLAIPDEYAHRHARGTEIRVSLGFILDAIETLVLPIDPREAFDLLVLFFKADGQAMENCCDHDFEVTCAFERAAELIGRAATSVPRADVVAALVPLMDDDGYGVRSVLTDVIASRKVIP
jgi:hypothetical protein